MQPLTIAVLTVAVLTPLFFWPNVSRAAAEEEEEKLFTRREHFLRLVRDKGDAPHAASTTIPKNTQTPFLEAVTPTSGRSRKLSTSRTA